MHRISLLAVGSLKTSWIREGVEMYEERLQRTLDFQVIEVPAGKQKEPEKQRDEEGKKIIAVLEKRKGDEVWVLDETGERMASQEFAFTLSQAKDIGQSLLFIIGGAYGLSADVRKAARGSLRLSDMTLPHELCRLVFLEQLYRAGEITKGTGYHH